MRKGKMASWLKKTGLNFRQPSIFIEHWHLALIFTVIQMSDAEELNQNNFAGILKEPFLQSMRTSKMNEIDFD